jgi:two-component system OmpR family response regulator
VGPLALDAEAHQVTRAGQAIRLSATEFRLLRYLMENAGRVVSKAQILDRVWRDDFGGDAGIVDTYISYLRRKADTGEPKLIHTVHGVGYVLREPRR